MFGRGPKVRRGDVRAATLAVLAERPLHGYQIIQEITERSGGVWRPSPGSVYPAVQQLEDEGLVRVEKQHGRRTVHLTDAGRAYVQEHQEELDAVWDTVTESVSDEVLELGDLAAQVGAAVTQVAHAGTASQVAEAGKVLADARRALYRILADGDPERGDQRPDGPGSV
jgi:DNA-binding PadR family transcriptional regulator